MSRIRVSPRQLLDRELPGAARRRLPPDTFSPVFVLAPARSHTSVVTQMLGQHPETYAFPELVLFNGETLESLFDPPRRH